MSLIDGLSRAQRVVVVIALGLALGVIGGYLTTLGSATGTEPSFGWYAYAPLNTTLRAPGTGLATWLRMIIWLVLIGLWALTAVRVLRSSADQGRRG